MWDYSLSRTSLSILYPDDMTTITTTNKHIIDTFILDYNHDWDDVRQDEYFESLALYMEGAARERKHDTKKHTPTKPYQTGIKK